MPFYRICPHCRAYLDFGEKCDCEDKEKAAQDAANTQGGKVDRELSDPRSTSILTKE